jgi:hypothetical protein
MAMGRKFMSCPARMVMWLFVVALLFSAAAPAIRAQTASAIDTSQWGLFRSDKLGFEVKYPMNWNAQIPTGTGSESVLIGGSLQDSKVHLSLQFWVQRKINTGGLSIEHWYDDQMAAIASLPLSTHTTLGARPAIRREVVGSLGNHFDWFTSLNTTDVFEVTITQPVDQTRLNPIYDAILSTLKFIK